MNTNRVLLRLDRRLADVLGRLDRADLAVLRILSPQTKRRLAKRLLHLMPRLWREEPLRIGETRLHVPRILVRRFTSGLYEPEVGEALRSCLRPGMTAVDVGANIGALTLAMSRAVGASGRVYSLEPNPSSFRFLKRNLETNGCSNVTALQCAAGRRNETRTFYFEDHCTQASFYDPGLGKAAAVEVRALDSLLPAGVDLVKIDVEGAEIDVLSGMQATITANPALSLIVEWCPQTQVRAGRSALELVEELIRLGLAPTPLGLQADPFLTVEAAAPFVEKLDVSTGRRLVNLFCRRTA